VALRACSVSCKDLQDVQHTVEVTAESLYEAVAKALKIFRDNDWVAEIGTGMTSVTVVVREPTVVHEVLMKNFERWLKRNGRTPAETARRSSLRQQLGPPAATLRRFTLRTGFLASLEWFWGPKWLKPLDAA